MFEYNMSETMAREILKTKKSDDKSLSKQQYLIKYVNEQFCPRLPVTKVYTTL